MNDTHSGKLQCVAKNWHRVNEGKLWFGVSVNVIFDCRTIVVHSTISYYSNMTELPCIGNIFGWYFGILAEFVQNSRLHVRKVLELPVGQCYRV